MAGSSPAMTLEFGAVPALPSGMKNAARRLGMAPHTNSRLAIFAALGP